MPTKADLKRLANPVKLKVRRGDKVMIIAGKDKGKTGFIAAVSPKENKVIVLAENPENAEQPLPLNTVIKHRKAKQQGERSARIALPAPLNISNVMVLDPKTGEPTRVGRRKEGDKLVRYAKKSGTTIKNVD
ncbi:MAG: 50S ribosomal protein L24 [Armatimonadetes bacterium Cent15-Ar3]|jgi:large subunit ribosomal protein L24|nr:MAG: 50S ribosomal protein L24 [Armatimonadetes bacterium Cent15-Ar3]